MKYEREGQILTEDIIHGGVQLFKKGTVITSSMLDLLQKLRLSDKIENTYDRLELSLCEGKKSQLLQDVLVGKSLGKRFLILRNRLDTLIDKLPKELFVKIKKSGALSHSISVALYTASMAVQAGLGLDMIDDCLVGGFLHDIGKSAVDPKVLNKEGFLTSEEFKKISEHTTLGAGILERYNCSPFIVSCALNHHEREDCKGYPNGCKLSTLPIAISFMHMVDIYDAISSERVYKHSLSRASAQKYLMDTSQFSKELIETFLKAVPILLPGECTYVNSTQLVLEDVTYDEYILQSNGTRICLSSEVMRSKTIRGGAWR